MSSRAGRNMVNIENISGLNWRKNFIFLLIHALIIRISITSGNQTFTHLHRYHMHQWKFGGKEKLLYINHLQELQFPPHLNLKHRNNLPSRNICAVLHFWNCLQGTHNLELSIANLGICPAFCYVLI